MCFSATASFVAAGTIGVIGVATRGKARVRVEVPLASMPLLFAAQQLVEGLVWLSFREGSDAEWNRIATFAYSIFSHVLWPVFVPFAVFLVEPDLARRKRLLWLLVLGAVVSAYLLFFVVVDPVTSEIVNHSIRYDYHHHYPGLTMLLYLTSVCGSGLASSRAVLRFFGLALAAAFVVAYVVYTATFFSVWCFFAAGLSLILYLELRKRRRVVL